MHIDEFSKSIFEHEGKEHYVYRKGQGPGVILMHEVPGVYSGVIELGKRIVDEGFTVFIPDLFGTVYREPSARYVLGQISRLCIGKEFHTLACNHASPITDWLKALSRHVHEELGGKGIGVIGLCVTGNFALTMMVDPFVLAPVLSEPALPFPILPCHKKSLHISPEDLAVVKKRTAEGVSVLGLRFSNDFASPRERFETLRKELGDGFEGIEIDSRPGNPYNNPWWAHSVLTLDFVDEDGHPTKKALERVIGFCKERLN